MVKKLSKNRLQRTIDFFGSINPLVYFTSVFIGTLGFSWMIVECMSFLGYEFNFLKTNRKTALYLWFIHAFLFCFIGLYFRELLTKSLKKAPENHKVGNQDSILAGDLIASLKSALKNKNFNEVIRLGAVLSRPLFISGYYSTRAQLGILVEEAAANTNNKKEQMIALIDSIGWSNIELGNFHKARKAILHGQEIAIDIDNKFYLSKSYRHLGVINRRNRKYNEAQEEYKNALSHAENLIDTKEKNESLGGINYALANLAYLKSNFQDAMNYIDKSIGYFNSNSDEIRSNLSLIKKADINLTNDKSNTAKDLYRKALQTARKLSHRLHLTRAHIGLAKIYSSEKQWEKAFEHILYAKEIDSELKSIDESKEIQQIFDSFPEKEKAQYNKRFIGITLLS